MGSKGLHLGRAVHQEEGHLDDHPLQRDQDEAGSEGDSERSFQGDGDVCDGGFNCFCAVGYPGAIRRPAEGRGG